MKNKLLSFVLVLSLIGLVGVLSTSYAANQAGVSPTLTEPKLARPSGGSEDSDNDSYSDLCEYLHKTNPNDSESKPSSNITINVPSDVKTIQGAINASVDGDTIAVSQGKYQGNINFNDKSITLTSTDPLNSDVVANTIIEGTESGSVVTIDSVSVLKGLTITSKGLDCRGIYIKDASPTIENCTIIDNQTTSYGGGIYMSTSSRPKIINCIISGNKDSSTGKSAQVYGGTPQISQSWINGQGLVDNTIEEPTTLIPETSTAEIIPTKTTPHIAPDAATPVIQNANKVGRTKWIKEGNIAHTYFENVKAIQEANISCSLAVSFQPPQFETKDSYNRIQISGLDIWNGTAGAPILPFKPMRILIPYGQKAVGVRVIPGSSQEISGEYILEPAQKPVPLSQLEYAQFTPPNPEIYNSDNPYPYVPCGDAFLQKKSGYTILILNLFPVEYHPLSRKILYYPNMSVEVETVPLSKVYTEEAGVSLSPDLQVQNEIKALVDNPDVLQTYETGTEVDRLRAEGEQYEYVIITNNALASAPGPYNFQALRDSKMARVNAMTATIVTTEYIYDNYDGTRPHGGTDNQTKIRNFIIDYYQNHGTRYVLLAGDSNIIPPRYLSVWYTFQPYPYFVSIPADLYYGCLDGTFDYDCDGTYGEHTDGPEGWEVDLYAEVYIGRAPVATAAEVSNFVRKTLTYENATGDYLHSVYMLGEHLGFGGVSEWATDALEEIRLGSYAYSYATVGFENSIYANYFETHTLYDSPSYSWTTSELIGVINAGVHIFNHFGHGDYGTCMCVNKPFCTDNLASLTNTDYFFVYSQACTPGSFDSSNCFAEVITTMDEGAFAVVMNARLGWGRYDSTDGPSQRYNRQFWDALLGENITNLGRMNQDSKEDNACKINEDYNCMQWCYYELNLFGDPEISINVNTENGPQIWYVDDSVSISGDGKTWNTAFKYLEDALNNPLLTPSDEIWVAQGTYKPDNTPPYDRTATFLLKNGVTIKGGYAGYGASNPYAHDIEAYSTILSGDLNSNDGPDFTNYDDNSYHVTSVFGSSIGPSYSQPTLDGFTIKGGNANGDWWDDAGGGMRNEFSAARIRNCTFEYNKASTQGGAMKNFYSKPVLFNCTFNNNKADNGSSFGSGGAIGNERSFMLAEKCIFSNNTARNSGGAVYDFGSVYSKPCTFINCRLWGNEALEGNGGAVSVNNSYADLTNCLLYSNIAGANGGAINVTITNGSVIQLCNNTIYRNRGYSGGGVYINSNNAVIIINSILWGNYLTSTETQDWQIKIYQSGPRLIYYSTIQDWTGGGTGNDANNPQFVDPNGADDVYGTEDDNLRLAGNSPAIDGVTNNGGARDTYDIDEDGDTTEYTPDLDGNERLYFAYIDKGAYEASYSTLHVLLVKWDAPGANNGESWIDAYTDLQNALANAVSGDEIWVAEGVYRPSSSGDRTAYFYLPNGVALYGGFQGNETTRESRDWAAHETILSGDLNSDDGPDFTNYEDNSYNVTAVFGSSIGPSYSQPTLDGFTIKGGNANGDWWDDAGGGMRNEFSAARIRNCTFEYNKASTQGGAMKNFYSKPVLFNCTFSNNKADNGSSFGSGGAIGNERSFMLAEECIFSNNTARNSGGAVYDFGSVYSKPCTFINCRLWGNSAAGQGGGGAVRLNNSEADLTNCLFYSNTASYHHTTGGASGGAINVTITNYSCITLNNVTIYGNYAHYQGGVYVNSNNYSIIMNSLLWYNTSTDTPGPNRQIKFYGGGGVILYNTSIEGWADEYGGYGNDGNDPLFVDPDGADDVYGTEDDNLRLSSDSPAINSDTNNEGASQDIYDIDEDGDTTEFTPDLDGNERLQGSCIDKGAYEYY